MVCLVNLIFCVVLSVSLSVISPNVWAEFENSRHWQTCECQQSISISMPANISTGPKHCEWKDGKEAVGDAATWNLIIPHLEGLVILVCVLFKGSRSHYPGVWQMDGLLSIDNRLIRT